MSALTARIFNIQRFSTEDGPGLRTTVFMKGCPLRCRWCHNPEGLTAPAQLAWTAARCARCYMCAAACPEKAITPGPDGPVVDRGRCLVGRDDAARSRSCARACARACATACPRKAMEVIGRRVDLDPLVAELLRDEPFYRASGGGVTFSGGEAGLQPEFLIAAAARLQAAGVQVALDTSGYLPTADFEALTAAVDLVLFDLKYRDPARHKELTGVGLELIEANFRRLGEGGGRVEGGGGAAARRGAADRPAPASGRPRPAVWVRMPIIPGLTDDEANARATARFILEVLPRAATPGLGDRTVRVDLLTYNNLAEGDYPRVGLTYPLSGLGLCRRADVERLREAMLSEGLAEVQVSGRFREPPDGPTRGA